MEPLDIREPSSDDKSKQFDNSVIINRTRLQPCDRIITLYTLYPSIKNKTVYRTPAHGCERFDYTTRQPILNLFFTFVFLFCFFRPFVVLPIPSSNLILLVVENMCPIADPNFKITTAPYEQDISNESLPCYRSTINLRRRRPPSCINRHINVSFNLICFSFLGKFLLTHINNIGKFYRRMWSSFMYHNHKHSFNRIFTNYRKNSLTKLKHNNLFFFIFKSRIYANFITH